MAHLLRVQRSVVDFFLATLLTVGAFAFAGCVAQSSLSDDDRQSITVTLERQRDAWNAGNLEGYMDGYSRSPQLVFTSGGRIRRGWEQTLQRYQKAYANREQMGQLSFTDVEIVGLSASSAVVLGHWQLRETPKSGAGIFSLVVVKEPSGWKIIHDHSSKRAKSKPDDETKRQ